MSAPGGTLEGFARLALARPGLDATDAELAAWYEAKGDVLARAGTALAVREAAAARAHAARLAPAPVGVTV